MATLYITEQNAWIRKTSDRLVIEKDDVVLAEIPCLKLETVFLFGNVQFTTQALAEMLDHGIELALFTLSGRLRGQLTPPKAKNVELRMRVVPAELGFTGRRRRPPPDPFNALLSFGYVIVGNEIQSLLDGMGFDPYLGFFHQVDYGRPSLALDLLEEFRAPLVDRMSLKLINLGVVHREDFVSDAKGGVYLNQEGKKRYFRFYEEELTREVATPEGSLSYRQLFRRQAERLARALRGEEPYRSFRP